jgi:predicted NAD-dependent protein-ADP-ribosyltransferase YbiA (DUF1768 family)
MVKSVLSLDIEYNENRSLLPEDKNQEASLYDVTLFNTEEVIALGQPVYTYIEKNIVYYPIYLVKNDKVTQQIGLYEFFADSIVNIVDADGDVDLALASQPVLYGFVNETLIKSMASKTETIGLLAEDPLLVPLAIQTEKEASSEREQYSADEGNHWIQSYMENNNYTMVDNEGNGDCLFAVIRDALAKVHVYKSVDEMRKILADNATDEIFNGYKTVYQDASDADAQLHKEITTLASRHKELKKNIDTQKDRNAKQAIIAQADEIKKRHEIAKRERAYTKSVIADELKHMGTIQNVVQFKKFIQTCSFWGDTWAISTLERVLNIKIVLFSEESYNEDDIENVITCGQLNDSVLEKKGIFTPDYYILTIYQGFHYQLISYKGRGALTFEELPYDVKMKVVDKCLERLAGPYYIIPDFRNFMATIKPATSISLHPEEVKSDLLQSDLFSNDTVFQFYSKSINKQPGKGSGEIIGSVEYKALSHIPDWRKKLSNFWIAPFLLDGHNWQSTEHYYQGSKYKRVNPKFYLQFSLDSGSALSKNPEMAKGAGGKTGKYLKEQIRPLKMIIDEDFFGTSKRGIKEMEAAQYAKFNQHEDLKNLLRETKQAKLQHFVHGNQPVVFYDLMRVRQRVK